MLFNLKKQITLNYDACSSPCKQEADGNFYCQSINSKGQTMIMQCFDPVTLEYIKANTDDMKQTFLLKVNTWQYRIKSIIIQYDDIIISSS